MPIQDMFNSMKDECEPVTYEGAGDDMKQVPGRVMFSWSKKGFGFGQLYFYFKDVDGEQVLYCDNECMGKETIKEILCSMVDNAVLDDV